MKYILLLILFLTPIAFSVPGSDAVKATVEKGKNDVMALGWILISASYNSVNEPNGKWQLIKHFQAFDMPVQAQFGPISGVAREVYSSEKDCGDALINYSLSNPLGVSFKVEKWGDGLIARGEIDNVYRQHSCIEIKF